MAYSFDQVFAADPANPQNVASNAAVLIYQPGDATKTPLVITDPSGGALSNPVIVNANGYVATAGHCTVAEDAAPPELRRYTSVPFCDTSNCASLAIAS